MIKSFGELVSKARRARGISQQVLADAIGLSRTSIVNIEKANSGPSFETAMMLMKYLSLDMTKVNVVADINFREIREARIKKQISDLKRQLGKK